ncbi:sensor histidine kinase [Streptomyces sp. NPDC002845]
MPGTRDRRTRHRSAPRKNLRYSFVVPFVVPAVLATGVWGYTAAGLADEQIQAQAESDRVSSVAAPAQALLTRLQEERRLTAVWQASRGDKTRQDLDAAREETDEAVSSYRSASESALDTSALSNGADKLDEALDNLAERRKAIDERSLDALGTFQYFTGAVTNSTDLLASAVRSEDGALAQAGAATTALVRLTEMLSREDALVSGALSSRRMSAQTRAQFAQYLAVQRELRSTLASRDLPAGGSSAYGEIRETSQWATVGTVENAVAGAGGSALPRRATDWTAAADAVIGDLRTLGSDAVQGIADEGAERADDLMLGLLLGSAATLAALVGGALLALRSRRSMRYRLTELQQKTEELSGIWLPELLTRLERGERVEPQPLSDRPRHATDEVERLGSAIDHLGRVAADTAIRQNLGREGSEKVFAQLIRRTQILIHRLISLLDDLERKHEDSDLLKDIFKVDHLATRVRRHAENLVILSGAPPSRRMTAPVSVTDVMRSAVAETEQYTRVKVKNLPADRRLALAGRAVADVTHLLAELIENGTSFSPPDTHVFISATKVAKGLAVHVEDHGLGVPDELREQANQLLAHPPKLDMTALGEDPRLGHFVVARLAERYKIKVELRESVYGGTLVVVLLPAELLEEIDSPVFDQLKSAAVSSGRAVPTPGERAGIGASSDTAGAGIPSTVVETALAGVGAGSGGGSGTSGGSQVLAGVAVGSATAGDTLTHTRMPDYSGFPDYGGAGLLPPASDHPSAGEPGPGGWTPPQEHPVHRAEASAGSGSESGSRSGASMSPGSGPGSGSGAASASDAGLGVGAGLSASTSTSAGMSTSTGFDTGAPTRLAAETRRAATPRDSSGPLTTPTVLPQRTRGASLAQQLRKEAGHQGGRDDDEGGLSPDASARAMIAIQQGLKRAKFSEDGEADGPDGRTASSRDPDAN